MTCWSSTHPNNHASPSMVNRIENLRSTVNIGRLKLNGIWTWPYYEINETLFYSQDANFLHFGIIIYVIKEVHV